MVSHRGTDVVSDRMADGKEINKTMTDRYRDIKQKLCKYAGQDSDIKAVIAIGSSTRSDLPADEYWTLTLSS